MSYQNGYYSGYGSSNQYYNYPSAYPHSAIRSAFSQPQQQQPTRSYASATPLSRYSSSSRQAAQTAATYSANEPRSKLVDAILQSNNPIQLNETEQISVNGVRGIYANRAENAQWRGQVPLEQYQLNQDSNPEVIRKKPTEKVRYTQEVAVRYLNPPPAPKPGDLIVRENPGRQMPAAPPLIVQEQGRDASTPPPVVYREAPPRPPSVFENKTVRIEGRALPPQPRRLVVEKFQAEPQKPAPIIIERWLPYKPRKVKVIYQKVQAPEPCGCACNTCQQQQEVQYVQQYEQAVPQLTLHEPVQQQQQQVVQYTTSAAAAPAVAQTPLQLAPSQTPQVRYTPAASTAQVVSRVRSVRAASVAAAAPANTGAFGGLEGDSEALNALRRVDLDRYGLGQYRKYL
jgi:hypothetical protein